MERKLAGLSLRDFDMRLTRRAREMVTPPSTSFVILRFSVEALPTTSYHR